MGKTKGKWIIKDDQSLESGTNDQLQVKLDSNGSIDKDTNGLKLKSGSNDGDVLIWNETLSKWVSSSYVISENNYYVTDTKPLSTKNADQWLNTNDNILYVYNSTLSKWISPLTQIYKYCYMGESQNIYLSSDGRFSDADSGYYFSKDFIILTINGYLFTAPSSNAEFYIYDKIKDAYHELTWLEDSNTYINSSSNFSYINDTFLQLYWGNILVNNPNINLEIAWYI